MSDSTPRSNSHGDFEPVVNGLPQNKIDETFDELCARFHGLGKYRSDLEYDAETNIVTIVWPAKDSWSEYGLEAFLDLAGECQTLTVEPQTGVIQTSHYFMQLVEISDFELDRIQRISDQLKQELPNGTTIAFAHGHFLVACAAIQSNAYHRYFSPIEYAAIIVHRGEGFGSLAVHALEELIDSFLFELADRCDLTLPRTYFREFDPENSTLISGDEDDDLDITPVTLRPLENFNEGMPLFTVALQVDDAELRLLSLYKVFEFFAPTVLNMEASEALRRKFDSPKALSPDGAFLASIFELSRSFEARRNDREMIRTVFAQCLDLVDLMSHLPSSLQQPLTYESKKADLEKFARGIADTLVSTRNQVVHAKSNHDLTGNECAPDQLEQFNQFLKAAAAQLIRWYNRLPGHQQLSS
jgi:hypothetical protein